MNVGVYTELLCDLRWRIEYHTGGPRAGFWNWPGPGGERPDGRASMQPKDGIKRVLIEAKDRAGRATTVKAECPGHDWIEVKWIACAPIKVGTHAPVIQGMTLVSRHEKIHVYVDGSVRREPRRTVC